MEDDLSVVKDEEGRGGQTYLVITAMAERGIIVFMVMFNPM